MIEKHIILDNIDPAEFYGAANCHLQMVKSLYPKLRITARDVLRVIGDEEEMCRFEENVAKIQQHIVKYNTIAEEDILDIIKGHEVRKDGVKDVVVYSIAGKPIKARSKNQQLLIDSFYKNDMVFAVGPAGTGKTYLSAFDAKVAKPKKFLFIVHRGLIARKSKKSYEKIFGNTVSTGLLTEGVDESVISERYIKSIKETYELLNCLPHFKNPKVTETMPQIIDFIDLLVQKGGAYVVGNDVYFDITKAKNEEGDRVLKLIKNDYLIGLDLNKKEFTSEEFADFIEQKFVEGGSSISFVIGGSYGLSENLKKRCNSSISLSKMTFLHQMTRLVLLEQIYRAFKILNNETYHK